MAEAARIFPQVAGMSTRVTAAFVAGMTIIVAAAEPPKSAVDPQVASHSEGFSHVLWDQVLSDHVNERGLIDYASVAEDARYQEYLLQLAQAEPAKLPSSNAKKAFWINAYNAMAIKGAIATMPSEPEKRGEYSVLSFKKEGAADGKAFFVALKYLVGAGGRAYTLDEIEKRILFRHWNDIDPHEIRGYARIAPDKGDPRLHFALVCCARGCPVLAKKAYTAADVDAQLEHAARRFFNDPQRSRFDLEHKVWRVSQLFEWYGGDFSDAANEPKARSLTEFASRYVADPKVAKSLRGSKWRIEYLPYDWRLNIQ